MNIKRPMTFTNTIPNLKIIPYPIFSGYKADGHRVEIEKGDILGRSFKPFINKQLITHFNSVIQWSKEHPDYLIEAEVYCHGVTCNKITHYCRTIDLTKMSKGAIKKYGEFKHSELEGFYLHVFNILKYDENGNFINEPFEKRYKRLLEIENQFDKKIFKVVTQTLLHNEQKIITMYEKALADGWEGLVLWQPNGLYKENKTTAKEGTVFKLKPIRTWDAQILYVTQATIVNPNAEKNRDELGRSVTSKKKNDRIPIDMAAGFRCIMEENGKEITISLAGDKEEDPENVMSEEEKKEIWQQRKKYIKLWIEFKGIDRGMEVPQHPVLVKMRPDKNGTDIITKFKLTHTASIKKEDKAQKSIFDF